MKNLILTISLIVSSLSFADSLSSKQAATSVGANTTLSNILNTNIGANLNFTSGFYGIISSVSGTTSQELDFLTGNASTGASGEIDIFTGSSASVSGDNTGNIFAKSGNITSAAVGGSTGQANYGSGSANVTSSSAATGNVNVTSGASKNASTGAMSFSSGSVNGTTGNSGTLLLRSGSQGATGTGTTGTVTFQSGNNSGSGATGSATVKTGDASGSANSGDVILSTGSVSAGTKGRIKLNDIINLPTKTNASPTNGDIWFDGTDLKIRTGGVTKTFTIL
jgi:hypothetical protein